MLLNPVREYNSHCDKAAAEGFKPLARQRFLDALWAIFKARNA